MKKIIFFLCISFIMAACQPPAENASTADTQSSPTVEGAWKLIGVNDVSANGEVEARTLQESFFLFTEKYYSMAYSEHEQSSPIFEDPWNPTDAERLDRFSFLTVNAGTYELSGSTMTLNPQFALFPVVNKGTTTIEYELSGDQLKMTWMNQVSADGVAFPYYKDGARYVTELRKIE